MSSYFSTMQSALRMAGIFKPSLVLDLDRLDANIALVKGRLAAPLRIVDKSLPCLPLIERIKAAFDTRLMMTFHPPVALAVLKRWPAVHLLFGKPMPVEAARQMLTEAGTERIVWLIDTPARLAQYGALASDVGRVLDFCFEVDVGLHRGGLTDPEGLSSALDDLKALPALRCVGLMAYEAHIGHIPALLGGPEKARQKSLALFREFVARLSPDQRRILNLGGSSTALSYGGGTGANEISMGSAFVKPTDFDVPSLADLQPAIFIATPVLKVGDVQLPGLDAKTRSAQAFGLAPRRGCYIYGGKWMAEPVYPEGMVASSTMGQSTNQQFFALPQSSDIQPDDYAFFRPTQSEFVLQQFGSVRVLSQGRIVDEWPALPFT